LAVAVGKPLEAIPLFKLALEINPQIEQFWLSYVDVLIKLERFDDARRVVVEGERSGVTSEKLESLQQQIPKPPPNKNKKSTKQGLTVLEKRKKLAKKKKRKKGQAQTASSGAGPSEDQINHLLGHYQAGRLEEAEALATSLTQQFPKDPFGWKVVGAVLTQTGRLAESLTPMQSAVKLLPHDAEAHSNLGVTLKELGRLDEAEASYRQAIALKPDYAEAHSNLGVTLKELGRLDEAEASWRQAIALAPYYAAAHYNLAIILQDASRLDEAEASYRQAIMVKVDYADAHYNLGNTLRALGRLDEAEASYRQAIAMKPENSSAKHLLAALSGSKTASAPLDYIEGIFNDYASKFEKDLVENLEYHIPKIIAEIILEDSNTDSLGSIIDLGCGTGLVGAEISKFCGYLEGVDLSQKMLNEARKKNVYDELIKMDILAYLTNTDLHFDYFIATDVFIYVGDLADVFHLIKSRNKTGGKLVFSTEDYDGDGFFLEQSGRYSHSHIYIEDLCKKFGYVVRHFETTALRKEKDEHITGGLYVLDF
jgi:predicted TPR repeat methyltransferase